jgi:hypothetical protein
MEMKAKGTCVNRAVACPQSSSSVVQSSVTPLIREWLTMGQAEQRITCADELVENAQLSFYSHGG